MAKFRIDPTLGFIERDAPMKFGELPDGVSDEEIFDKARTAAMLTATLEPERQEDLDQLWRDSVSYIQNSNDPDGALEGLQRRFAAEQERALLEQAVTQGQFLLDDEQPLELTDFEELEAAYAGQRGRVRAEVDSAAAFEPDAPLLDVARDIEEVNQYGNAIVKQLSMQEDKWSEFTDKVGDYGGFLFVPDFNKDLYDIGMSYDKFSKLATAFQQLDKEDQMAFLEEQLPTWYEEFEQNEVKTFFMLHLLNHPDAKRATSLEAMFDLLAAGDLVATAGVGRGMKALVKGKALKDLGAEKTAARLADRAAKGDKGAQDMAGMNQLDAADSINPAEPGVLQAGKIDGVSHHIVGLDELVDEVGEVRTLVRGIAQDSEEFASDFLTHPEMRDARKSAINAMREAADRQNATLTNVRVEHDNPLSFTVQAKFNGSPITARYHYQVDDAGRLNIERLDSPIKNLTGNLTSAETVLSNFKERFVSDLTFAGQQSTRIFRQLDQVSKGIDSTLSKKEMRDLDAVLISGDEQITGRSKQGFVYSVDDLKEGVDTPLGTVRLNEKQIHAYYKRVAFFEELGMIQNDMARKRLNALGMKEASYTTTMENGVKVTTRTIGREIDFSDLRKLNQNDLLLDPSKTKGKYSRVSTVLKQRQGHKVIELLEPMWVKQGAITRKVTHAVVPAEGKIRPLPDIVLNIAPGYVPRIRKKGMVYVKDMDNPYRKTVRAFDGMHKARMWVDDQIEKALADGEEAPNYQPIRDDEMNEVEKLLGNFDQVGGLYTSPRKKSPLLYGEDGITPERLNVGQASKRYTSTIAKNMPINMYRMAMVRRWENSANAAVRKYSSDPSARVSFLDDDLPIPDSGEAGQLKRMLNRSRNYLRQQFSMQNTNEYATFRNTMLNLVDFMEGRPILGSKPRNWALNLAYSDPVAAVRGATFNATLGLFNIRQLYVQAQNAAISFAAHPVHGVGAAIDGIGLQLAFPLLRNGNEAAVKTVGKMLGQDGDEFLQKAKAFKQSGMPDSIMRTADYDAQVYGVGSTTFNGLREVARKGRVFYEQGELYARSVSWGIAQRRFTERTGRLPSTVEEIKEVSDDAFRLHINMQRENAAAWQTNKLTAIPTQFLQARAKFFENLITASTGKGRWSRGEASRILAGQIAFYGLVGVPMSTSIYSWIADMMDLTPAEIEAEMPWVDEMIEEGIHGVLTQAMGLDVNVSQSGSLLADLGDNVVTSLLKVTIDLATTGQADLPAREALGPALNVFLRTKDATLDLSRRAQYLMAVRDPTQIPEQVARSADAFAQISSSWSNARKAQYMLNLKRTISRRGSVQIGEQQIGDEIDVWDAIFRSMGFPLDAEVALYEAMDYNISNRKEIRRTVDDLSHAAQLALANGDTEVFRTTRDILLSPYSPLEQRQILNTVIDRAFAEDTVADRQTQALIRHIMETGETQIPSTIGDLN